MVRRTIGFAQQDSFLFSTTVARNIGFSLDDTDTAEAHRAIRARIDRTQEIAAEVRFPNGLTLHERQHKCVNIEVVDQSIAIRVAADLHRQCYG